MMPAGYLALLLSMAGGSSETQAPVHQTFWSFIEPGTVVTRCERTSKEHQDARQAYEGVRARIEALDVSSDIRPALAALDELLHMTCFRLAIEHGPPPWPAHPVALKTWWEDGGSMWLWTFIEPLREGLVADLRTVALAPPDARTVLSSETNRDPALAPLLCPLSEATCGADTQGWMERAREALRLRPPPEHWSDERKGDPDIWHACAQQAASRSSDDAYTAWRNCLTTHRAAPPAFPLGRTRAPRRGWLLVTGRRGHYDFCDGVRAYDLATGAAYVAESCAGLALKEKGEVDFGATDAARRTTLRAGSVPADNLREAAWMIFLKSEIEERNTEASRYPIPRGMAVRYRVGPPLGEKPASRIWSTAWTILHWRWLEDGRHTRAEGELTWPTSDDRAEAYAATLLDITERAFVEGCPPAPLPTLPPTSGPPVSDVDALPAVLAVVRRDLWEELAAVNQPAACAQQHVTPR